MKNITTFSFTFEDMVCGENVYVDKTDFVWELAKTSKGGFFMSRPRRFGKSLMVSTLKAFFQGKRELFQGLKIDALCPEDRWQSYPVVHLDMTHAASPVSIEEMRGKLSAHMTKTYADFGVDKPNESPGVLLSNLISELYSRGGGKGVVVLIDEYDKPILDAMYKPFAAEVVQTLHDFYATLKAQNATLRFVFATGVSKFAHTSLFSGSNLTDITRNDTCAAMFGYTQKELEGNFAEHIEAAMAKFGNDRETLMRKVKARYNGYRFVPGAPTLYNPVSIGRFFSDLRFDNYWWETATPTLLVEALRRFPYNLEEATDKWSAFDDYGKSEYTSVSPLDLATQAGYLTIAEWRPSPDDEDIIEVRYDFPNNEVRHSWEREMLRVMRRADKTDITALISDLRDALNAADTNQFMELLQSYFAGVCYENAGEISEGYFRNMLRCIFVLFGIPSQCEVQVARGRIDVVAQTRKAAFVMEVKVVNKPAKKSESSEEERQIAEMKAKAEKARRAGLTEEERLNEDIAAMTAKKEAYNKSVNKSLDDALNQAAEKQYALKYRNESEIVRVIAVVFDYQSRQLVKWRAAE